MLLRLVVAGGSGVVAEVAGVLGVSRAKRARVNSEMLADITIAASVLLSRLFETLKNPERPKPPEVGRV